MPTLNYVPQYRTTTLSAAGGLDSSQTTGIVLASIPADVDITKAGIVCITYADPINTSTAEWITYTSISGGNELQGVTRGQEGYSAKAHLNGATIAWPLSKSHINDLNKLLDGTTAAPALNRPRVTTSIDDTSGNEVIKTPATGSAVNEITVTNAATNDNPTISATGGDTNIGINIKPKGSGVVATDGPENYAADAGASDTYAITVEGITAYATGQVFKFKANTINTGAATLNVNSLGAKTIVKNYNVTLADGDIKANQLVEVIYDGTNMQLLSPISSTGAQSGISVMPNATVSLTSATYADIPTSPLSVTLTTRANSIVLILLTLGAVKPGAASQDVYFQIVVDGVEMGDNGLIFMRGTGTTDYKPASLIALRTNLTAASHTIKVQYKMSAGTGELNSNAAGSQLVVVEL